MLCASKIALAAGSLVVPAATPPDADTMLEYSNAVAPEFTRKTCFAVPMDVRPVPPWAAVTAALSVNMVADAFGKVKVLVLEAGPVNAVNPLFVPPRDGARIPDQPTVILAEFKSEVVGEPPSVNVTLVSSVFVSAPAAV